MPGPAHRAVFLSYASQDAEVVLRIADALRATGVEVWFDKNELVGGDAWDQKIRRQIKECALFVPVISANTQARREGYFRIEWKLAAQRTHAIAEGTPFLLPTVTDSTTEPDALVPGEFRDVQWTRIETEKETAAFCARVGALLAGPQAFPRSVQTRSGGAVAIRRSSLRHWAIAAIIGVVVIPIAFWQPWRREEKSGAPDTVARSGAPALIQKAWEQLNQPGRYRTQLEVADDFCRRATTAEPDNADAWAAWSQVHTWYVYTAIDQSAEQREAARVAAARAVQLDPKSFEARLAQACYLVRTARGAGSAGFTNDEAQAAEPILRALLAERPDEPRVCFALAILLRNLGREDESMQSFDAMAAAPPFTVEAWTEKAWLLWGRCRFAESQALCDRALARQAFSGNLLLRIYLTLTWTGDLDLAKATIESLSPTLLQDDKLGSFAARVYWWRREPQAMLRVLDAMPRPWITWWNCPKSFYTGQAHSLAGEMEAAQVSWREALRQVEARAASEPENAALLLWKAELLGLLGRKDEAASAMRLARGLRIGAPAASWAFELVGDWSVALAIGDREAALDSLEKGYERSDVRRTTWAILRLNPQFDPLRSEPRFQALLARAEADPARNPHVGATPVATAAPTLDSKSVAVLAFDNLSDDKANEYFSDGISEELINALGRVPGLRVIARTSSFSLKGRAMSAAEIGGALKASHLVEGSVQRVGAKARVIARLLRADTGEQLWSDRFDQDLSDIFAAEDAVAGAIAKALSLRLGDATSAVAHRVDPAVFELYARGRQAWNEQTPEGLTRADRFFREAVARDPLFARAYVGLADTGRALGRSITIDREALAMVRKALELDADLAEAHASLGALYATSEDSPRFDAAEQEFTTALRLNPNYAPAHWWQARLFEGAARLDEALESHQRAVELDPLSTRIADNHARALLMAGQTREALAEYERALRLEPGNTQARSWRAWIFSENGRRDEALAEARDLAQIDNTLTRIFACDIFYRQGLRAEADRVFASIPPDTAARPHYLLPVLSRGDDAIPYLAGATIRRDNAVLMFFLPRFDELHRDPRFRAWIKQMGLDETFGRAQAWRAAHPPEKPVAK